MGDLLIATFPAKRSIVAAGNHLGMAATSVLEPIVLLYRDTGDERYLQFRGTSSNRGMNTTGRRSSRRC